MLDHFLSFCLFSFFFFKQKTAYDLRISDWSSDVCSSDLLGYFPVVAGADASAVNHRGAGWFWSRSRTIAAPAMPLASAPCFSTRTSARRTPVQIGRASCRERVCQYV